MKTRISNKRIYSLLDEQFIKSDYSIPYDWGETYLSQEGLSISIGRNGQIDYYYIYIDSIKVACNGLLGIYWIHKTPKKNERIYNQ